MRRARNGGPKARAKRGLVRKRIWDCGPAALNQRGGVRMSKTASPNSTRWRLIFAAGLAVGFAVFVLFPQIQRKLNFNDYGLWFLDSYAVLAASDTALAGGNPEQPMVLDFLHRTHKYSDWWYALGHLGLSRADNFLVGGSWVVAFVLSAGLLLRPEGAGQT